VGVETFVVFDMRTEQNKCSAFLGFIVSKEPKYIYLFTLYPDLFNFIMYPVLTHLPKATPTFGWLGGAKSGCCRLLLCWVIRFRREKCW